MRELALLLGVIAAVFAQEATSPAAAQPTPAAQSAQTAPVPTAPAPTAPAPTAPVPTLQSIRRLYIEKMSNDLDQYIRTEIVKQMKGRLTVALSKEDADAVMTGIGEYRTGTGATITGRYLGLHDNATASVSITDREGRNLIWSSEAGDRSLMWGVMSRGGPRKVADRLVSKLKKAMEGR